MTAIIPNPKCKSFGFVVYLYLSCPYNMYMAQSERLFFIIDRLLEDGIFTKRQIAEKFELSDKQVQRDIEFLRDRCPIEGLPNLNIIFDRGRHGYVLDEDDKARLDSWRFNQVLVHAISVEKNLTDEKILSDSVRQDLEFVRYKSYAYETFDTAIFSVLFGAMKRRHRVLLYYPSWQKPCRVIEPLRLINYGEIWYLLGPEKGDDFIFTYSVSRIEKIQELDEEITFTDYEKLERMSDSYGIWYSKKGFKDYTIRFTGWAKDIVMRQVWQKDQRGHVEGDSYILTLPSSTDVELMGRILFYGEFAEPLAPPEFVEKYRKRVRAMADRFATAEE